jgi:hypothetical protein
MLFLMTSFLFTSCVEEPEAPKIQSTENGQLMKVKAWFEENKKNLRLPERGSNFRSESQELILPFFEKEPDWDKFHHYYFLDGREVFEVSLEGNTLYFPKEKNKIKKKDEIKYFQNILFVKHQTEDRFDPLIIRYYPEEIESNREFEEVNYQMIDEKWSGWIDLFSYDEHYLVGYKIDRGQFTHTRTMQKGMENAKNSIGLENKDVRYSCSYVTTDWIQIVSSGGDVIVTKLDSTTSEQCGWEETGGPRGGAPTIETSYSGGGSGTGYYPPEVPAPNLRIQIDPSFSNNQDLKCILEKMQLSKFVNNLALFDGTVENGRNVILKVGDTINPAANAETSDDLGPYRIEITINQSKLERNSLEMARTILHEIIHAELFVAIYHKNGSPIDGNFESNFAKYISLYSGDTEIHHNYMAENMVDKMASVLSQIHSSLGKQSFLSDPDVIAAFPKGLPSDFYHGIAWNGLKWTDLWRYNLPDRVSYEKYQKVGAENLTDNCNSN